MVGIGQCAFLIAWVVKNPGEPDGFFGIFFAPKVRCFV